MIRIKFVLLAFLGLTLTGCGEPEVEYQVVTRTVRPAGFYANAHLIMGQKDAILIDALMLKEDAKNVIKMVNFEDKNLTTILITHPHADHYLGLDILKAAFPNAKIVAAKGVADTIRENGAADIEYWKPTYGHSLTDEFVVPDVLEGDTLLLEGAELKVIELPASESVHPTVVYFPAMKAVFTGDLAYSDIHLWLAENRADAWLKNIDAIKALGPLEAVYPGHGERTDPGVLDDTAAYIRTFSAAQELASDPIDITAEMKSKFPELLMPDVLDYSAYGVMGQDVPSPAESIGEIVGGFKVE